MTSAGASIARSAVNWVFTSKLHVIGCTRRYTVKMRKQELLDAVVAEVERGGIGDRSLREIGAAVGTSHRMLIHHFGSREGLLTELVRKVEEDQRRFLE